MSKPNQIQTALRELDGARFQKLCDAYLHRLGYEAINPLGSMIGKDKVVTGTPDTYVPLPSGKYVFAEYTTKTEGVTTKFVSDLSKVFNPDKTGIPIEKIAEVILCHTSVLDTADDDHLREVCSEHSCSCTIIGIGPMAEDLYQKYPGLARDFLGIAVDTGQVVTSDEFVAAYNKGKLATPLDTPFHFREEETGKVIQALEAGDLVILSGHPGIGKTQLALECSRRFSEAHPEVQVRCIFNRGVNLFEDLRVHFMPPGHYLLVVDDANRATRFDYVLQLIHDQRADRTIKIIATVRDYALEQIRNAASNYHLEVVNVAQFKDEQIRQLVEDTWDIHHHIVLNRIADIAQGNPRLAMMAAQVAVRENTFDSIYNVSDLYEEYFSSIREDLERLSDKKLMKVAGIVAFFRAVDRTNAEVMKAICSVGQLSPEAFWEGVTHLHELEVLNMHEAEVVKFSDQVLASYLFYCAVFKERVLAFSDLLTHLFPLFQMRFVDALNPVLSAFDGQALAAYMRPLVNQMWKTLEERGDEEGLFALISVFWFAVRTEVLTYVRRRIQQMESIPHTLGEGAIKAIRNPPQQSLLNLLRHFQHAPPDECRMSIALMLGYLAKRPKEVSHVLQLLTETFGFQDDSDLKEYATQHAVIEAFGNRTHKGKDTMYERLLLAVGLNYLQTHCNTVGPARGRAITITRFDLAATPELHHLRRTIWQYVFTFYQQPSLRKEVIDFLHRYSQAGYRVADAEIISWDAKQVLPFIESELEAAEFSHCVIVHEFLALLRRHRVDFPHELASHFTSATYALREVLLPDWQHRRELGYAEYEEERQRELAAYFAAYTYEDYISFLDNCLKICGNSLTERASDQLRLATQRVLLLLAARDGVLFTEVLEQYLRSGDPLSLDPLMLVSKLIEVNGPDRVYQIITEADCSGQPILLFTYFHLLPPDYLRPSHLEQMYTLYRETEKENLRYGWNYLLIYRALDPDVVVHVTEIILQRTVEDNRFASWLERLFDGFGDNNIQVNAAFQNHLAVLKRAYCAAQKAHGHMDYEGEMFSAILDRDPDFVSEYVASLYQNDQEPTQLDDGRKYDFLWQRVDYVEIMDRVAECAFTLDQQRPFYWESPVEVFFRRYAGDGNTDTQVMNRKKNFLGRWIEQRHNDVSFIDWLFHVIMRIFSDERIFFIECFVRHNQCFADFCRLPLEPSSWSGNGNWVPVLQKRIDAFQVLLPLFNTIELLEHRQYLQNRIDDLQKEMKFEMKKDFMRD